MYPAAFEATKPDGFFDGDLSSSSGVFVATNTSTFFSQNTMFFKP